MYQCKCEANTQILKYNTQIHKYENTKTQMHNECRNTKIPIQIEDSPAFPHRGVMLVDTC